MDSPWSVALKNARARLLTPSDGRDRLILWKMFGILVDFGGFWSKSNQIQWKLQWKTIENHWKFWENPKKQIFLKSIFSKLKQNFKNRSLTILIDVCVPRITNLQLIWSPESIRSILLKIRVQKISEILCWWLFYSVIICKISKHLKDFCNILYTYFRLNWSNRFWAPNEL